MKRKIGQRSKRPLTVEQIEKQRAEQEEAAKNAATKPHKKTVKEVKHV